MALAKLTGLSFEAFIEHAFGHEVPFYQQPWYLDLDAEDWAAPAREKVAYLTRLFNDPEPALAWFSDAQIAQGLYYLVDNACGGHAIAVADRSVPMAERLACVASLSNLYARLFAPRCMWWESWPGAWITDDPDRALLSEAEFAVMDAALALDSIACQESALHGLGHACRGAPERVAAGIDAFLAARTDLRPELASYARSARGGCVL